jgi:hypothetical protein
MTSFMSIDSGTGSSLYLNGASSSIIYTTPVGSEVTLKTTRDEIMGDKGVNVRLFFKLVHSKLTHIEKDKLSEQLYKLQQIVNTSRELGQQALYERLSEMIAIAVREMEVAAVGCDKYVDLATVEKFRKVRKENGKPIVFFEPWEKFPRIPPPAVAELLKHLQSLSLFDEYWVLYLDYARNEELKTNKERIKEKDPILFGKFSYQPNRLYFIIDWVDDFCDLTLDRFIDEVKLGHPLYMPEKVSMTYDDFERIKKEVMERHARLKATNGTNFRMNMIEEDKANKKKKRSWFSKLLPSLWRKSSDD